MRALKRFIKLLLVFGVIGVAVYGYLQYRDSPSAKAGVDSWVKWAQGYAPTAPNSPPAQEAPEKAEPRVMPPAPPVPERAEPKVLPPPPPAPVESPEAEQLRAENVQLRDELAEARATKANAEATQTALASELSGLKGKLEEAQTEISRLTGELGTVRAENARLAQEVTAAKGIAEKRADDVGCPISLIFMGFNAEGQKIYLCDNK